MAIFWEKFDTALYVEQTFVLNLQVLNGRGSISLCLCLTFITSESLDSTLRCGQLKPHVAPAPHAFTNQTVFCHIVTLFKLQIRVLSRQLNCFAQNTGFSPHLRVQGWARTAQIQTTKAVSGAPSFSLCEVNFNVFQATVHIKANYPINVGENVVKHIMLNTKYYYQLVSFILPVTMYSLQC